ncbi:MAG TPA: hypothetical protein VLI04_20890 [Nocardioidaceae bacterium]|nr:hypothetical protein [Nocardioidaceae bacterium]
MFSEIDHLALSRALDDDVIELMQADLMARAGEVEGLVAAYCTQPARDQLVLVLLTHTAEEMKAVHEIVSPWIAEHLAPYLASQDRKPGPVIAHS